jgi:general nucleoside transport system ATP-binding protein
VTGGAGDAAGRRPALELVGIDKHFGAVHANRHVNVTVRAGTVHGIIGENGAGKSTLMSIVYGYYQPDAGQISVAGRPVTIRRPADAIAAGIGMVHQHFMLVDRFTVLENIVLGAEGGALLAGGMRQARAELARIEREYGLNVDPDAVVGDLPVGLQQRVEILKALFRGAQTLILDEPTGVLTPQEADDLFRILRLWREQGRTVILITHKLREVLAITDNVTVMRRGEVVANVRTAETSREQLAELMVGRRVNLRVDKPMSIPAGEVLTVSKLRVVDSRGVLRVKDVSFSVRAGEIVGIAGVSGNGQSELMAAIAGLIRPSAGHIYCSGTDIAAIDDDVPARAARRLGLAHVPEDRQRMGLVTPFPAYNNAVLGYQDDADLARGPFLSRRAKVQRCARLMETHDVRPLAPYLKSGHFSGGNQQKIVLGREMDRDPDLLLVGQPTRGVDIGAIEFIHKRLVELRNRGKAILLVSVELDEILALADRILIMCDGALVGAVVAADADERMLGLMMAGESGYDTGIGQGGDELHQASVATQHQASQPQAGQRATPPPLEFSTDREDRTHPRVSNGLALGANHRIRNMNELPRWVSLALMPLLNLVAAFAVTSVVVLALGQSPVQLIRVLVTGSLGNLEGLGFTLYYATAFIFTGLAVAVAFHAGLFNIGGEGQAYIGGLGVGLACLTFGDLPFIVVLPIAILASVLFGAAWALIPAWLQAQRGSHIVITTIMFNFLAAALMTFLMVDVLIRPGQQSPESREFAANAWMPAMHEMLATVGFAMPRSPLNLSFVIALMAAVLVWVYIWHTRWGYALRTVGHSEEAARYAGISPSRQVIVAMLVSGALAGMVGLNEIMGYHHRLLLDFTAGAGFIGIAVALMGRNHPFGVCLAAVLFGALYQGGTEISFDMPGLSREMIVVIQGLVILFCGALENLFRPMLGALFIRRRIAVA